MGVLDNFEKKLENVVHSAFSGFGSKDIKPVDFSQALKRELDSKVIRMNLDRSIAPNSFKVILSTADFDKIEEWGAAVFADELATDLANYAKDQTYQFAGPVRVEFEENIEAEAGQFEIIAESVRGTIPENAPNISNSPTLTINSKRYALNKETVVIGRDSKCDIALDDSGISRRHLEIRLTPLGAILCDLGSTNGIFLNGHKVESGQLRNGDIVSFGRSTAIFNFNN